MPLEPFANPRPLIQPVPLLVKVARPKTDVGQAPSGTVQPEEIIMSPSESLVIITWVNVTEPQVMVVSSFPEASVKVTVKPEGNVPEDTSKFPPTDIAEPE